MKLITLAAVLMYGGNHHSLHRKHRKRPSSQAPPPKQETPASEPSVIRVGDNPDQIIRVRTRVRHTTIIQLPGRENILDFVVGDSEYWHLTGAANLAFLKPISEGVSTNVALVCESGRIYSFLVTEQPGQPHLVVRIASAAESDPRISPTIHQPAFVARDQVAAYQQMAEQARQSAVSAQTEAEQQIDLVRQEAAGRDQFLPGRLSHAPEIPLPSTRQGPQMALPGARHVARRPIYLPTFQRSGVPGAL